MSNIDKHTSGAVDAIIDGLAKRYENDSLVDFKIKCRTREWNVHKLVLAMHSSVLAVAVTKNFKEFQHGYIDLSEDDPQCIEMLVYYLYKLNYHPLLDMNAEPGFHVEMCVLADKYDIPPLGLLAVDRFKQSVAADDIYITRQTQFSEAVKLAYSTPDVTKAIRSHMVELMAENDVFGWISGNPSSDLAMLLRENGDVACDVALALRERFELVRRSKERNMGNHTYVMCQFCGNYYPEDTVHSCF